MGHEVLKTENPTQKRHGTDLWLRGRAHGQVQDKRTKWVWVGEPSPGPDAGRWEYILGERHLVAVETDEVASTKASHHDTECAEAQGADGKVAGPPGADGQEDQEVDTGEGRRVGDACKTRQGHAGSYLARAVGPPSSWSAGSLAGAKSPPGMTASARIPALCPVGTCQREQHYGQGPSSSH